MHLPALTKENYFSGTSGGTPSFGIPVVEGILSGKNADVFYRCRRTKITPILNNQQVNPFILLARSTVREITRLDIMAYLDPASNPGSKPQRLGVTNCKSSTSDKLQTFRTLFGISCKFLTKNYLHEITLLVLF